MRKPFVCLRAFLLGSLVTVAAWAEDPPEDAAQEDDVDFARQILPILSNHCFICHGPDINDDTDLRLDSFAGATRDRGGSRAIDVEDLPGSELLARLHSNDDPMPPVDAEKQLSDRDRDLIDRWVKQGAQYATHWAFVPPTKSRSLGDPTAAIDTYIGDRLKDRGIDFAPSAAPSVLARRAALVLTGLPPEPELLSQFLANPNDEAYGRLVDELLSSPKFGEHQARYWLDAVRYGDTHGLHLDNRRGIYPYRDWVVRAFNENLPLDQFITWQIAGDLLPDPTLDQQIATGFVRLNPSTGEGGAIPAEFQMKNNFDRVETLGTALLGMSLTCARCHTHKFDPIEQTEYYQLLSFFNSTAEPAMDGNSYTYGPTVNVPADLVAWEQWKQWNAEADALLEQQADDSLDLDELRKFAKQRSGWSTDNWQMSKPVPVSDSSPPALDSKAASWASVKGLPGSISGRQARKKTPSADQIVWVSFDVTVPHRQTLQLTCGGAAGSHVLLDRANVPVFEKQDSRVSVVSLRLEPGKHHVQVAIRGRTGLAEIRVDVANGWDGLAKSNDWSACSRQDQLRMLADSLGPLADTGPLADDRSRSAADLAEKLGAAEANFTTTLIAKELPKPRPTHLLARGEYDLPVGEPLVPDVVAVMSPFPEGAPRNRVGLARWLTSSNHPLVARVLVNRLWQRTLGHGLVRTPEDFGVQGQQSTHPELLDWLAVELQQQWDLKEMLRAMVLSRTFRQSSAWRDDIDDPENRFFSRATSYRLDAEVLRDIGLWASGLLDPHMGGEGVKPYQPVGMWAALAHPASNTKQYVRDHGDLLYRRSLYIYWKRTSPHPMMTLFDAPDRESSCVRRSRTNTPLQSLGMLNETQRIEMGRTLATRIIKGQSGESERIHAIFQLLACRDAKPAELKSCQTLLSSIRKRYQESPQEAAALLAVGDAFTDPSLDAAELAAWSQLATTLLATDIAILMY